MTAPTRAVRLRYTPGASYLVVGPVGGCLTADRQLAERVWLALQGGEPISGVLIGLLAGGLVGLPDLALFEFDGADARVILRGALTVDMVLSDGTSRTATGAGVRTWAEHVFPKVSSGTIGRVGGPDLPLVHGIVLADGFGFSADEWDAESGRTSAGPLVDRGPGPVPGVPATRESILIVVDSAQSQPALLSVAPPAVAAVSAPGPESAPTLLASEPEVPSRPSLQKPPLAETRTELPDESFQHLFESTILRSVEDAAVRDPEPTDPGGPKPMISAVPGVGNPAAPAPPSAAGPVERLGDHDGSTIMAGQLAALRGRFPGSTTESVKSSAVLVLGDGTRVHLDRPVILGRRPQVDRVSGAELPRLVTVLSPNQDISRNHLQIQQSESGYIARDLGATNGSVLRRLDGSIAELSRGAELTVAIGDCLDLGDGVVVRIGQL